MAKAEIKTAGYQSIRDLMEANWIFIELRSSMGSPWGRLEVGEDPRVYWSHEPNSRTLEITVELKGDDGDLDVGSSGPVEFGQSGLYLADTGGDELSSNTFTSVTLEVEEDQLVVKHRVEVPVVV